MNILRYRQMPGAGRLQNDLRQMFDRQSKPPRPARAATSALWSTTPAAYSVPPSVTTRTALVPPFACIANPMTSPASPMFAQ